MPLVFLSDLNVTHMKKSKRSLNIYKQSSLTLTTFALFPRGRGSTFARVSVVAIDAFSSIPAWVGVTFVVVWNKICIYLIIDAY